jgi:hypothetical protein
MIWRNKATRRAHDGGCRTTNLHVWSDTVHCCAIVIYNRNTNPSV